jgi:hypothetical protein
MRLRPLRSVIAAPRGATHQKRARRLGRAAQQRAARGVRRRRCPLPIRRIIGLSPAATALGLGAYLAGEATDDVDPDERRRLMQARAQGVGAGGLGLGGGTLSSYFGGMGR